MIFLQKELKKKVGKTIVGMNAALSACNLSRKVEWSNWSRSRRGAGNAIREEEARLVFARRAVTW